MRIFPSGTCLFGLCLGACIIAAGVLAAITGAAPARAQIYVPPPVVDMSEFCARPPPARTNRVMSSRPNFRRARARGEDALVMLDCSLTPAGAPQACSALIESPAERGFGARAMHDACSMRFEIDPVTGFLLDQADRDVELYVGDGGAKRIRVTFDFVEG